MTDGQLINPQVPEDTGSNSSQVAEPSLSLIPKVRGLSGIAALPESMLEVARIDPNLLGGSFQSQAVPAMLYCLEGMVKTEQTNVKDLTEKNELLRGENLSLSVKVAILEAKAESQPISSLMKMLLTTFGGLLLALGYKFADKPELTMYASPVILSGCALLLAGWIPTAWAAYKAHRNNK